MSKRFLVIGSEGFLGKKLVKKLEQLMPDAQVVRCDKKIMFSFEHMLSLPGTATQYDCVYHLGANIESIDLRRNHPLQAMHDMVLDMKVAQWCYDTHQPRVVYPSSCVVAFPDKDDPYTTVKTAGEAVFKALARTPGAPHVTIFRPYSGYGPGQSLEYPVPAIIGRALRQEDPLTVWGNGLQVRDFVFVDDIIAAMTHHLHGETFRPVLTGVPVELGTGLGTSLSALASVIAAALRMVLGCSYHPRVVNDEFKPTGAAHRIAPSGEQVHYWACPTTLGDGLLATVDWAVKQAREGA